jgi:hypothetical protein
LKQPKSSCGIIPKTVFVAILSALCRLQRARPTGTTRADQPMMVPLIGALLTASSFTRLLPELLSERKNPDIKAQPLFFRWRTIMASFL